MSAWTKGNITVVLEGRGKLVLHQNDHIATGGEGSVFRAQSTVVKLYSDTDRMQREGLAQKLKLLSHIKHEYIVGPINLVTIANKPVGYYMHYVDGEPLCPIFTNDFRTRRGFGDADASVLVDRMRITVDAAHGGGATMVDANELNWLAILGGKPAPRVVDVDSWAIGQWPAKVIMLSIRDWHSQIFNQTTDWFSWGIVTFQVYSGIHPYKGVLAGYKPSELERRMKDNASVFSPGVRLNRAVRDFSVIPPRLLDWYVATFQHGERTIPPSPFDTGVSTKSSIRVGRIITVGAGENILVHEQLFAPSAYDPVIRIFSCGVALLKSGTLVDLATRRSIGEAAMDCKVVAVDGGWLIGEQILKNFTFSYISSPNMHKTALELQIAGYRLVRYENRLFLVTEQGLTELSFLMLGRPVLSAGQTWGAMPHSTRWFDGVGVQDALGAMYLVAPFGDKACALVRMRELDGLKAVDAKAGNRFVSVVALDKSGNYQKFQFTFSADYTSYTVISEYADNAELNLVCLPKGVCAAIVEDGELIIFVPVNGTVKKLGDREISTAWQLANWGDQVVYIKDGQAWRMRMR